MARHRTTENARITRIVALLLAVAAAGCSDVTALRPVGKTAVALRPGEWNGLWIVDYASKGQDNEVFSIPFLFTVVDEEQGTLRTSVNPEIAAGEPGIDNLTLYVRACDNALLLSYLDNSPDGQYLWGLLRKSRARMELNYPDPEKFRALVDNGAIPGTATRHGLTLPHTHVVVGDLSDDQLARIVRDRELFLKDPVVFTRWAPRGDTVTLPSAFSEGDSPGKLTKARVRWAGIVADGETREVPSPGSLSGTEVIARTLPQSKQETTRVPARLGTKFGIKYVIQGVPKGDLVMLREVWRFPEEGLKNPGTGKTSREQAQGMVMEVTGHEIFAGWALLYEWELVPGVWTYELWSGDRLILSQSFDVYRP